MCIKNIKGEESPLFAYLRLCDFYAFMCVKFSPKKQRSLKLSKRTKTKKAAFLCA